MLPKSSWILNESVGTFADRILMQAVPRHASEKLEEDGTKGQVRYSEA